MCGVPVSLIRIDNKGLNEPGQKTSNCGNKISAIQFVEFDARGRLKSRQ